MPNQPGSHRSLASASWLTGHPRVLLAIAGLVSAACVAAIVWKLRPSADLMALLPPESAAANAYAELVDTFGTVERVVVMVRLEPEAEISGDGDPLLDASDFLQQQLLASGSFSSVRAGLEPAEETFWLEQILPRAPLLLPDAVRVRRVREAIAPTALRIRADELARTVRLPVAGMLDPLLTRDPLGLSRELPGLDPGAWGLSIDPLTGAFVSLDRSATLLIARTRAGELDAAAGRRIGQVLEQARQALARELGTRFELYAVGGPLYAAEDERLIRHDLSWTIASSSLLCWLLLCLSFGGVRAPLIGLLSVAAALVWTGGALALGVGSVAAMSLGFAAVLVGLGIDYSIHGLTRMREHLAVGATPRLAVAETIRSTGPAIAASALTTAGAFALLLLATLRPLRELGLLVALGMVAMLLSTLLVGAPMAFLWLAGAPTREGRLWRGAGAWVERAVRLSERHPWRVLGTTAILLALSAAGLPRLYLAGDLRALRPEGHRTLIDEQAITATFDLGLDAATVLVDGPTLAEALATARRTTQVLRTTLDPATAIDSPSDWLLDQGELRRRLDELSHLPLAQAATSFESELRRVGLNPAAFAAGLESLRRLGEGRDPVSEHHADLPELFADSVHRTTGHTTVAIRVRAPAGLQDSEVSLRTALSTASGTAPRIATPAAVGRELGKLAREDLEKLLLLATLAVVALVSLSFAGRPRPTLAALLPASVGTAATLGSLGWLGGRLDLISVAVLPVLLGIGVDDGLHAVHAALHDRGPAPGAETRLGRGVASAGRAMVLTTLTTGVAFATLTLSSIPGLRRAGLVVAAGVSACLLASLLLLPALGVLGGHLKPRVGSDS